MLAKCSQPLRAECRRNNADAQTATASAVAQHLIRTGWSILCALILVATVFGWTSGRALLKTVYIEANQRAAAKANAKQARTGADVSAGG